MGAQFASKRALLDDEAGNASVRPRPQLLDLVHLSCHTFGDPDLERDVLRLFLDQAENTARALRASGNAAERGRLYHLVRGSARGVGAFELAEIAHRGETRPQDEIHLAETLEAIQRVCRRVSGLLDA